MTGKKFGTAINCIDGRVQGPVTEWIKSKFSVDYVDSITVPGPDKFLAERSDVKDIYDMVEISVKKHGSRCIVIAGHHDCVGNPEEKGMHIEQIKKSVDAIKGWGFDAEVFGLWIGEDWQAEEVC